MKEIFSGGAARFPQNIPCGFHQCRRDENLTLFSYNDQFLDVFGYDAEEIKRLFKNSYIEMIHPLDREKIRRVVSSGLPAGETREFEYRVVTKNGEIKWILDRFKATESEVGTLYNSVIMDISSHKKTTEELRLSLERLEIIMNHTSDIIFEWDFESDEIQFSSNLREVFGCETPQRTFLAESCLKYLHPEDAAALSGLMERAKNGIIGETQEMRVVKSDGDYNWCRVWMTDQFKENGLAAKAIGVVTDIDKEKKLIESLKRRAERDALTGLYNREETETLIDKSLASGSGGERCALLIIDIDNFKFANDTNGHLFGDAVLSEMSAALRNNVASGDVVGRIGGDEFAVFLKNVGDKREVVAHARRLLNNFNQLFTEEKRKYLLACSIGVSFYPDDGGNFEELYTRADIALYNAKSRGKNRVEAYKACDNGMPNRPADIIAAEKANMTFEDVRLPGYVLQILYQSDDVEQAVSFIMEIVGSRFDVSRSYIFENSADGTACSNTFEWCNKGVESERDSLQNLPYSEFVGYRDQFDKNGIFYCRDVGQLSAPQRKLLGMQGIKSVLQCAIRENGKFVGFVGFDECTGQRLWTNDEIKILTFVSQLLSTFLYKKRALDRYAESEKKLRNILDSMDSYIYVVEKGTFSLLYFNQKTREIEPRIEYGDSCYHVFFSLSEPCRHCPIKNLEKGESWAEYYNPKYNIWTLAAACPIAWDDKDTYLVTCHNYDPYKKRDDGDTRGGQDGRGTRLN